MQRPTETDYDSLLALYDLLSERVGVMREARPEELEYHTRIYFVWLNALQELSREILEQ